jgi:hypothetical protein
MVSANARAFRCRSQVDFDADARFTRGWTLQELIAPHKVTFLNSEWECIGSKSTLSADIAHITGIDTRVLAHEGPLSRVAVSTKMKWASNRVTTRVEDTAYCLLGLFDVNMPLLYGEEEKAFQRLQEEIIKCTPDLSIFGWKLPLPDQRYHPRTYCGLLAKSPSYFSGSEYPLRTRSLQDDFSISHHGVSFRSALHRRVEKREQGFSYVLGLFFSDLRLSFESLGVLLRKVGDDRYLRVDPWHFYAYGEYPLPTATSYATKYLLIRPPAPVVWDHGGRPSSTPEWSTDDHIPVLRGHTLRIKLPPNITITEVWPKANFDDEDQLWFMTDLIGTEHAWGMLHLSLRLNTSNVVHYSSPIECDCVFLVRDWTSINHNETSPIKCSVVSLATHQQLLRDIQTQATAPGFGSLQFMEALNNHGIGRMSPAIIWGPDIWDPMAVSFTCKLERTRFWQQMCWTVEFSVQICPRENVPVVERVEWWEDIN